jgi:hypothetical protein
MYIACFLLVLPLLRARLRYWYYCETLALSIRSIEDRGTLLSICIHVGSDNVIAGRSAGAAPWAWRTHDTAYVLYWGFGCSQAAPKTLDAGSGRGECVVLHLHPTQTLSEFATGAVRSHLPGVWRQRPWQRLNITISIVLKMSHIRISHL